MMNRLSDQQDSWEIVAGSGLYGSCHAFPKALAFSANPQFNRTLNNSNV